LLIFLLVHSKHPRLRVGAQFNICQVRGWPRHQGEIKPMWPPNHAEEFNHLGLLVNWCPGTTGLPFHETSELEFNPIN